MSATDILAVQQAEAILQWYIENGVDEAMSSTPVDRLAAKPVMMAQPVANIQSAAIAAPVVAQVSGTPEAKAEAIRILADVKTLDELKAAILSFEGLAIKKTAMNMVFASGNVSAPIMVIGDAPEAEDDRAGIPFSGEVGQLADKMFAAIGLNRAETADAQKSIYFTNVLNWRPPGNRSPLAAEIELSIPFIRKHIELVKPKAIYLMGGVAAKAVLGSDLTIGKLRGKDHMVQWDGFECPAMVSYHPSFLIRSPLKKREAWDDLLLLKERFLQ
jgi:uracil-DNA glycosylase family 4